MDKEKNIERANTSMNNIKKYRERGGYRLQDIADLTGLSVGYISLLENGFRNNPSYGVMKKFSAVFEESISEIFP